MVKQLLNPSNVPPRPNPTSDKARLAELEGEFARRLRHLQANYVAVRGCFGGSNTRNDGLSQLSKVIKNPAKPKDQQRRLPPDIEILITATATTYTEKEEENPSILTQKKVDKAALKISETIEPTRNRPADEILIYHVEALMALIIEFSGQPVTASRYKNSVYDPRLSVVR